MFDIGGGELFGLGVVAVLLFGPDRLPHMAREAASFLRKVREFTSQTTAQIKDETGSDLIRDIGEVTRQIRSPRRAIVDSLLNPGDSSSSTVPVTKPHFDPETP